mmetsp:Transcript_91021/g.291975  ORF Transcript_91021/g.291975 Transcript_91021/m.291975 type:complete len:499 (+) Transcript_91021:856-2352(+)
MLPEPKVLRAELSGPGVVAQQRRRGIENHRRLQVRQTFGHQSIQVARMLYQGERIHAIARKGVEQDHGQLAGVRGSRCNSTDGATVQQDDVSLVRQDRLLAGAPGLAPRTQLQLHLAAAGVFAAVAAKAQGRGECEHVSEAAVRIAGYAGVDVQWQVWVVVQIEANLWARMHKWHANALQVARVTDAGSRQQERRLQRASGQDDATPGSQHLFRRPSACQRDPDRPAALDDDAADMRLSEDASPLALARAVGVRDAAVVSRRGADVAMAADHAQHRPDRLRRRRVVVGAVAEARAREGRQEADLGAGRRPCAEVAPSEGQRALHTPIGPSEARPAEGQRRARVDVAVHCGAAPEDASGDDLDAPHNASEMPLDCVGEPAPGLRGRGWAWMLRIQCSIIPAARIQQQNLEAPRRQPGRGGAAPGTGADDDKVHRGGRRLVGRGARDRQAPCWGGRAAPLECVLSIPATVQTFSTKRWRAARIYLEVPAPAALGLTDGPN